MMKSFNRILLTISMLVLSIGSAKAEDSHNAPIGEIFTGKVFACPKTEQSFEKDLINTEWKFTEKEKGGFTFMSDGVKDVQVTPDGILKFTMKDRHVLIGWGHIANEKNQRNILESGKEHSESKKMVSKEGLELWDNNFFVRLNVRQSVSSKASQWTMKACVDGKAEKLKGFAGRTKPSICKLAGKEWKSLEFKRISGFYTGVYSKADGLLFGISAEPGTVFEIKNIDVVRSRNDLFYFRKKLVLPKGGIWRAIASVGNQTILYVNGKEVRDQHVLGTRPIPHGAYLYQTRTLDLEPYLHTGNNVLAIYGIRDNLPPHIYLQGSVVMDSGEMIPFKSDETWRWSSKPGRNWKEVGFDDKDWNPTGAKKSIVKLKRVTEFYLLFKTPWNRPGYEGLLLLENPYDPRLFYDDTKPVVINTRVPIGLEKQTPQLVWTINRVKDGKVIKERSGIESRYLKKDNSLVFELNTPSLPRGVYTIKTELKSGSRIIEDRLPEPFVVIGKVPMKSVTGDSFEQGMDLMLESEIDFTDPNSPYVSLETDGSKAVDKPLIVERNGLKYRETRPSSRNRNCVPTSTFYYNIQFEHPGDFYLMELEYPDDMERWMGVSCTPEYDGYKGFAKTSPAVFTGGKYPVSNTMRKLRWIHMADPGFCTIAVMSIQKNSAAAASGLKVYHIKGNLPSLQINNEDPAMERMLGVVQENLSFKYTFEMRKKPYNGYFLTQIITRSGATKDSMPIIEACLELESLLDTCEKYTQYLRFTGQNLAVIGFYQYIDEKRSPLYGDGTSGKDGIKTFRVPLETRDMAVRVMGQNGINVLANIEFLKGNSTLFRSSKAKATDVQVGAGADTLYMVDGNGTQGSWNFVHPEVEKTMLNVANDVVEPFKEQNNFLGIFWMSYFGGGWQPVYHHKKGEDPFAVSYDDTSIELFEKDTGIKVPGKACDPKRFKERYDFLTSEKMKPQWIQWRCEKIREFFGKVLKAIQKQRSNMECVAALYFYPEHTQAWLKSGLPLREYLMEWGWDPELYKDGQLWFPQMLHATANYASAIRDYGAYAASWEQNTGKDFSNLYSRDTKRSAIIHHAWVEVERSAESIPKLEHWARPHQSTMMGQGSKDIAREIFTQAMIDADPEMLIFGFCDNGLIVGSEQPLREFARVYRSLPLDKMNLILNTGFDTNLAIRAAHLKDDYYVCVMNPGYWPLKASIGLSGASNVVALNNGKTVQLGTDEALAFSLPPYGIIAWRMKGNDAAVTKWRIKALPTSDLMHMQNQIKKVKKYLANSKVVSLMNVKDVEFIKKFVKQIEKDLLDRKYAAAWSKITNWRFWTLVNVNMKKMAELPAGIKKVNVKYLPHYRAKYEDEPVKLDGELKDRAWRATRGVKRFVTDEKWTAAYDTNLRIAYDKHNLYISVDCVDPAPNAIRTTANGEEKNFFGSGDDIVAFYIKPDQAKDCYYQLAFTAGGVKFDQKVELGEKDYAFKPDWGVKTGRTDNSWTAEVKIPLSSINATITPGKRWRFNCFRQFRNNLEPVSHWSWPQNGHNPNRFGYLNFAPRK